MSLGAATVPLRDVVAILLGYERDLIQTRIILDNRLPQVLAALIAGAGLSVSGAVIQSVLRNPLAAPTTLGISNAAAFGAALTLFFGGGVKIGSGVSQSLVASGAFLFSLLATGIVLLFGRVHGSRSETMILIGVALNSLFSAGLILLQYLSDENQLAAIVHWTFGDTVRANFSGIGIMLACLIPVSIYFLSQSWSYNALLYGEETARGLGVAVGKVRCLGMLFASLLTAVLVSLLGVIGFLGLVAPHLARFCVGSDLRFLLPFSLLSGGLLLLIADTFARVINAPQTIPVSILTAFIGVPVFLSLLLSKR